LSEKLKTEANFNLTTPFEYAHKGQAATASFIQLSAPTARNSPECSALKQAFFRAAKASGATTKESEEVTTPTGAEVIMALAMSQDVDLPEVLVVGRRLLTSGIALVDGEEKLTAALLDKMSDEDFQNLLGEFLVAFCLASVLSKTARSS
jgi:hypothetical protein